MSKFRPTGDFFGFPGFSALRFHGKSPKLPLADQKRDTPDLRVALGDSEIASKHNPANPVAPRPTALRSPWQPEKSIAPEGDMSAANPCFKYPPIRGCTVGETPVFTNSMEMVF
jgi:hypothetical protein